jgi:hypothetical protein
MEKRVAGFIIAPLWNEFMQVALPKMQQVAFNPPEPTPQNIPPILRGSWNNPGSDGRLHSILYWVNKQNPRSGQPSNPYSDSQFNLWEYPVSVWSGAQASSTPSTNDIFSMTNISTGSVVPPNVPVPVQIVSARMHEIQNVTYFLNEQPIGTVNSAPFSVLVTPTTEGPATLRATATGSFGTASHSVIFLVQ